MAQRSFGTVEQLRSGKWRAYWKVDGQRQRAPMTFDTKTDARAYLATVRADHVRGILRAPIPARTTLDAYGQRWITDRPDLKATTRDLYALTWRLHVAPYVGSTQLDKVTPDQVRRWHADLSRTLARKSAERASHRTATNRTGASTVARAYRLLHAVMATAVEDDLIAANPCRVRGAGQVRAAERPTLTLTEVDALAAAVPAHYRALVLLLAWSGLRIGEAAALQRRDFTLDPDRPAVTVRERLYVLSDGALDRDAPKSRAGRRTVALPPHLVPELDAHLSTHTGPAATALAFTTTGGTHVLYAYTNVLHRALARIGRDDVRVHDLRHTGMTLAAEAGASLPELMRRMGQSSTAAAQVYLHATDDHAHALARRLSARAAEHAEHAGNVVPLRRAVGA